MKKRFCQIDSGIVTGFLQTDDAAFGELPPGRVMLDVTDRKDAGLVLFASYQAQGDTFTAPADPVQPPAQPSASELKALLVRLVAKAGA